MRTSDWARLQTLFETAIEMPQRERAGFVAEVCPDTTAREALETLIAAWEQAGDFLEAGPLPSESLDDELAFVGRRLGSYRIVEEMGRGGMGTVYRAIRADDQFHKSVAIKVVRNSVSSQLLLERFRSERQILATLEHPNIARLLDGGTEDGCPWLAMELIDGEPIDAYCDRLCLSIRDRLKLFQITCSAVQYAHQHLVVHRDLKPSNILVTKEGSPKLLDFGIAKLLRSESQPENANMLMMTPDFASPEQVRGEPITTASDVYSLGVLLYLLLTGRHPYASAAMQDHHAMLNAICKSQPLRPSSAVISVSDGVRNLELLSSLREGRPETLRRRLKGDVDSIVLKALCKEASERYESVYRFSEDIKRYLEGQPVEARASTVPYRALKFLERNKKSIAAVALLILTLLGGLFATIREARIANRRFNDVRAIASSDLFELYGALEKVPGSSGARYIIVQRALTYLDRLNSDHLADPALLTDLATGYERVAGLQGNFSAAGIGDSSAALRSYEQALLIRSGLAKRFRTPEYLSAESKLLHKYARLLHITGQTSEALAMANRELDLAKQAVQDTPDAIANEANAHLSLAAVLGGEGSSTSLRDLSAAVEHSEAAIKLREQLNEMKSDGNSILPLVQAKLHLAEYFSKMRRFGDAKQVCKEILALPELREADPELLGQIYNRFGLILERAGDQSEALEQYRTSFTLAENQLKTEPNDVLAQTRYQIARGHISMQQARLSIKGASTADLNAGVQELEKAWKADPSQSFYANLLLVGYAYQAEAALLHGDLKAAQAKYLRSLATAEDLMRKDAADAESRLSTSKLYMALGIVALRSRQLSEAGRDFAKSLAISAQLLKTIPDDAETHHLVAQVHAVQAALSVCNENEPCPAAQRVALPTLLN